MEAFIRVRIACFGVAAIAATPLFAGCGPGADARTPSAEPSTSSVPAEAPPPPAADGPIHCKQDADCPGLACGPCDPGAPITQLDLQKECVVNPCGGVKTGCSAGVCVVR